VSVLGTEEDELHHLLWSADARVLVAADLFREIRVWDLATCRSTRIDDWPPCHVFEDGSCGGLALFGLAVSPSGDRVFGVFDDDGVVVWDAASGQRLAWWKLPANDRAWGGTVSADGRLFAVGAASGVQVFRISGGALAPLVSLAVSKGTSGEDGYGSKVYFSPRSCAPEPASGALSPPRVAKRGGIGRGHRGVTSRFCERSHLPPRRLVEGGSKLDA
jgi:WD40 repeat protein